MSRSVLKHSDFLLIHVDTEMASVPWAVTGFRGTGRNSPWGHDDGKKHSVGTRRREETVPWGHDAYLPFILCPICKLALVQPGTVIW